MPRSVAKFGRTRAVVVVHLTGCPADIKPIADFCSAHNLILIEDCAQALHAKYQGLHVGTFGTFGCYSLNDQKHITSGEGGFVLTNSEDLFYLCHNYADKFHDRHRRGVLLQALASNYRMSEIDGAMFSAQLPKLDSIVSRRRVLGRSLTAQIRGIPGIIPQKQPPNVEESYFFYLLRIDPQAVRMTRDEFVARLRAEGIPASGAYVPTPLYNAPYFRNKSFFPGGVWPAEVVSGQVYRYDNVKLPGVELAVATGVSLPLNEGYSDADISDYVNAISKVAGLAP
jgi:perosamine synthetase